MAYSSSAVLPRNLIPKIVQSRQRNLPTRLFIGLLDAIERSNRVRAEREIARYFRTHKFTDDSEREIERRFLTR